MYATNAGGARGVDATIFPVPALRIRARGDRPRSAGQTARVHSAPAGGSYRKGRSGSSRSPESRSSGESTPRLRSAAVGGVGLQPKEDAPFRDGRRVHVESRRGLLDPRPGDAGALIRGSPVVADGHGYAAPSPVRATVYATRPGMGVMSASSSSGRCAIRSKSLIAPDPNTTGSQRACAGLHLQSSEPEKRKGGTPGLGRRPPYRNG